MTKNLKTKITRILSKLMCCYSDILEDPKGLQLISIVVILGFALLFIVFPEFWLVYFILGFALIILVERKFRARDMLKEKREKEIDKLKKDVENKNISGESLLQLADKEKDIRLAIAQLLAENFNKYVTSAQIIEKFSDDMSEDVRDAALYAFRQNISKFLNPSDVFEKFLKANDYSCDYAIKLIYVMRDNFEKISTDVIEHAITGIAKSDLHINANLAKFIGKNALGMAHYPIDVKTNLANFIDVNSDRIKNKGYAINLLIEEALKIEAENENKFVKFIVSVANCVGKNYKEVVAAQNFVERFSRSMNGDICEAISLIVDKNLESIKNLNVVLENLAYIQSDKAKDVVRKNLRREMQNYDKILKILET